MNSECWNWLGLWATTPKLLLLDEAMAGLNPAEASKALDMIWGAQDEFGITILWIEHVMKVITRAAQKLVVMQYGQKIAEGPPDEILKTTGSSKPTWEEPMLEIQGLEVAHGVIPVLHGIDLTVAKGELVALPGVQWRWQNVVASIPYPDLTGLARGSIKFEGQAVEQWPAHRLVAAGITQIPEGRKIFPYFSSGTTCSWGPAQELSWPDRLRVLEQVYELFPILGERHSQRASLMSGGEQQMLVIARGLMAQPKLLMIDEPSLGLSPVVMSNIYSVIKTFPEQGITVLLSEQNVQAAWGLPTGVTCCRTAISL